ncbi:MAG: AAA family ATPase, partial [Chloroflexi bacterium]|nr:AAA family ATPase [Chloroflexota bacterium]
MRLAHQERPAHGDRTRAAIVLDQAQRAMFDIQPRNAGQHRRPIGEVIAAVRDRMDQRIRDREAGGSDLTGVPSGYQQLDAMTGGWQPGDLIVLAARTGDGKTAFAVNLLCRAAHKQIPGAFFSLEMPAEQIGIRMVSMVARIDGIRIRDGKLAHRLDTDEPGEVVRAMSTVAEWPVHIDDTPALSTIDLRRDARRMVRDYQIGIIFVDYLQLMTAGIRTERRVQEVTEITRALKALARELNIPVIACAQLNRAVEERTDGPRLSDLRESGSIEQDADMVLFLHRQA